MGIVTLIGAGQMASALTFPLFENGNEVRLVGTPLDGDVIARLREDNYHINLDRTLHEGIKYYTVDQVEEALDGAELVVCGVSSFGVDWFLNNMFKLIPEGVPVISVTKGMIDLPDGTLQVFPEYWQEHMPEGVNVELFAIGGPCTARDLSDHDHSFVAYCGKDLEKLEWIRSHFETDYYHIALTDDVVGLEAAVALKNGYALGTAMAIGLKNRLGDDGIAHVNSKSALFQQSVWEMYQLLDIVGGDLMRHIHLDGIAERIATGRGLALSLVHPRAMFTTVHAAARNKALFALSDAAFIFNTDGRRGELGALQNRWCANVYAWEGALGNHPLYAHGAIPFGSDTPLDFDAMAARWSDGNAEQISMFDLM